MSDIIRSFSLTDSDEIPTELLDGVWYNIFKDQYQSFEIGEGGILKSDIIGENGDIQYTDGVEIEAIIKVPEAAIDDTEEYRETISVTDVDLIPQQIIALNYLDEYTDVTVL